MVTAKVLALIVLLEGVPDRGHADGGLAHGSFGIHKAAVQDVNRIYGTKYKIEDAHDRTKAIDIASKYLTYYGQGRCDTPEQYYELWRRGPTGYKRWQQSGRRSTAQLRGYHNYNQPMPDIRHVISSLFSS